MPWESEGRVRVQLDVIAHPEPLTYLLPADTLADAPIGAEVVVPLKGRRVSGWVIPDTGEFFEGQLRSVIRARRPAGPPGAVMAALLAGKWYGSSPVYFLRQTIRKKVGGCTQPEYEASLPRVPCDPTDVSVELLWSRLDTSGERVASDFVAALDVGSRGIVVVPTERRVERCVAELRERGISAVALPNGWDALAQGLANVAVGTRGASLAPIDRPQFCIVVDPIDQAVRSEASPYFEAFDLARVRCAVEGIPLHVVAATPPLALNAHAIKRQPPRAIPNLAVYGRSAYEGQDGGISGWLAREIPSWRKRVEGEGVAIVVPNSGAGSAVECVTCHAVCVCERCGGRLRPVHRDPAGTREVERLRSRLRIDELICSSCVVSSPPRCHQCRGTSLRLRGLSLDRFGAELEGLVREPVVAFDPKVTPSGRCRVGTVGLLADVGAHDSVVFLGLDRFVPYGSLLGRPIMWYLLHRALVKGAGLVVALVDGDADVVAQELARGDLARLNREDSLQRAALELPPYRALALWHGVDPGQLSMVLDGALEVRDVGSDRALVVGTSEALLHDVLASHAGLGGRIEFSPRILRSV